MKWRGMVVVAGLVLAMASGAWAGHGHGRHTHRQLGRQVVQWHVHQYPMALLQYDVLHGQLGYNRWYSWPANRRTSRYGAPYIRHPWRSVYGYTPGYVPPAAVYSGAGYDYAYPSIGITGRNFGLYINP